MSRIGWLRRGAMGVMQHSGRSHPRPHASTTDRHRSPDTGAARDLAALVHTHPDTHRPYARSHAGRDTARAQAHANAEGSHRHPHPHAGGG